MSKDKRRYTVVGEVTISMHVEVEASSPEEAIERAEAAPMMSLCHQCGRGEPDEWSTSGEFDGEPTNLEAEEIE